MTREMTEEQRKQLVDKLGLESADDPLAVIRKQRGVVLPVIQSLGITSSVLIMALMMLVALGCAVVVFGLLLMVVALVVGVLSSRPLTSGPMLPWISVALALPSLAVGSSAAQKMFNSSFTEIFRDGKETFLYGREERAPRTTPSRVHRARQRLDGGSWRTQPLEGGERRRRAHVERGARW